MYHNGAYIKRTLSFDEDVVFFMRQHAVVWMRSMLWGFLALVPLTAMMIYNLQSKEIFFMMFILFLFVSLYKYLEVALIEMALTNKRIIRKQGVVWVRSEELLLSKVESIEIDQSIMGRILGYGTISFCGTGSSRVNLTMVANPLYVKREIESYFDAAFSGSE